MTAVRAAARRRGHTVSTYTAARPSQFLDAKRARGDEPADEAVRRVTERHGSKAAGRIFNTLIRRLDLPVGDLPEPLPGFIREQAASVPALPDEVIDATERVFRDHGPRILLALYHGSLPTVYVCRGIARVLTGTGRLAHDDDSLATFSRRVAETGQFVVDVLGPNGMRPAGTGISTALKVRLIHAAIRQFTTLAGGDTAAGEPINQEDLALTLTTFGITIVDVLDALGTALTEDEAAAYLQTWNTVGKLLGIDDDLLPATAVDARALQARILERQSEDTAEGRLLTRALVEYVGGFSTRRDLRDAPALLIRYLAGAETADRLGVRRPHRWWSFLVPVALRGVFGFIERLEGESEPLAAISDTLSGHLVRVMIDSFNSYKGQPFHIPASLQTAWGIP